mmetsp:Transcript_12145/g.27090  ORF Transcript_12145/g.27090 Transcript_12145/m.27090 type:complete len:242 (-) Transcript_12145:1091-1816(-)
MLSCRTVCKPGPISAQRMPNALRAWMLAASVRSDAVRSTFSVDSARLSDRPAGREAHETCNFDSPMRVMTTPPAVRLGATLSRAVISASRALLAPSSFQSIPIIPKEYSVFPTCCSSIRRASRDRVIRRACFWGTENILQWAFICISPQREFEMPCSFICHASRIRASIRPNRAAFEMHTLPASKSAPIRPSPYRMFATSSAFREGEISTIACRMDSRRAAGRELMRAPMRPRPCTDMASP